MSSVIIEGLFCPLANYFEILLNGATKFSTSFCCPWTVSVCLVLNLSLQMMLVWSANGRKLSDIGSSYDRIL